MDTQDLRPGDPVNPCHDDPTLRVRAAGSGGAPADLARSTGYTSRGYVQHFLPDREVNLAQLNKALADVFGEPALRMLDMKLTIDPEYWMQLCGNPWSGNVYQYRFFAPRQNELDEVARLSAEVQRLSAEVQALRQG
jgi:hypothetical protein